MGLNQTARANQPRNDIPAAVGDLVGDRDVMALGDAARTRTALRHRFAFDMQNVNLSLQLGGKRFERDYVVPNRNLMSNLFGRFEF